jgi:hypothetical protein
MTIPDAVVFYAYVVDKESGNKDREYYCFRHAVLKAVNENTHIDTDLEDKDYLRLCDECGRE